ncbi:RteC domain-containing protein [Hymenobacter baengnokdamensis]|uniref:RteC domain-containing protein n=1 Tax=Hymenobacter baengnokdamensis TaxID=2615203 RepID=UPI001247B13B|nr:RteC domain-containing protein [Hymenobacter baengnokdamensis]
MDYLYQLPEEDREEEGFLRASNYALTEFLKLDLKGIPAGKIEKYITDSWWKYIEDNDLTNEDADSLLAKIQDESGFHIPYSPNRPSHLARLVEETPLYRIEISVNVWVFSPLINSRPADALHARYHWQILQERVHELIVEATPEAQHIKTPRLQAAIDWLKGYELRLATTQERLAAKTTPLTWQGTKAELTELGYSLLESGAISATNRAAAVKSLGEVFGVALGDNPAAHLQTIQKRKIGAVLTPLLDKLKTAFVGYLERKTESEALNRTRRSR